MNCIHQRNPFGGFSSTHRAACCVVDCCAPATHHAWLGNWCGNLCSEHLSRYKRPDGEVTEGPSILEDEGETMK